MNDKSGPKAAPETTAKQSDSRVTDQAGYRGQDGLFPLPEGAFEPLGVDAVLDVLETMVGQFTADAVHDQLPGRPANRYVMGSAFVRAHRLGVIKRAGWYRPSARAGRNGSAVAVWIGTAA